MNKTVTLVAIAAAVAVAAFAGQAQAASPADQRIAALERQVAALTRALAARPTAVDPRVAGLQKRVTKLEKDVKSLNNAANAAFAFVQCTTAATADAFAGTWNVVDQIAQATQAGKVYFGPQAAVNDFQSCSAFNITRQQTVPPNVSVFSALTTLIG